MLRQTSYKIAKYTSWIIILLGVILPFIFFLLNGARDRDLEGLVFGYIFAVPFLIGSSILFLVILWITKKWKKTFKPLLILFVITLISFVLWLLYIIFSGGTATQLAFIVMGVYILTLIESIILLTSNN